MSGTRTILDTIGPASEPSYDRRYSDGSRDIYLGGEPTTGALANQALALTPFLVRNAPIQTRTTGTNRPSFYKVADDGIDLTTYSQNTNVTPQFWRESVVFQDTKVYQRGDLISPNLTDSMGRTNLQRMQMGRAPIGPDGESINLHHVLQTQSSPLAEMTQTFHQQNRAVIHINPNSIPSGINRPAFDIFRQEYWMNRAWDFGGGTP